MAEVERIARVIRVGRRTYRKVSQRDRRHKLEYSHPELRLSNAWLERAGFAAGDLVELVCPEPGALVVIIARPAATGDDAQRQLS